MFGLHQIKHRFIRLEQCPACAKLGKDKSKDNLGVYSNGKWCFKCGYQENSDGVQRLKELLSYTPTVHYIHLPEDCSFLYPEKALKWIKQYNLTKIDLLNHNVLWSEEIKRLIFPIIDENTSVIAWQGRYFGDKTLPKWSGKGDLKNTYNILGKDNKIILCEDIISAIKLSKYTMAMPLYGCTIGSDRFKGLYKLLGYNFDVRIWLDPDMRPKALKEMRLGNISGLKTSVIYSEKDPKEHSEKEILALLEK